MVLSLVAALLLPFALFADESNTNDECLKLHAAPKPLAPNAVTTDWRPFLGPTHNAISPEQPIQANWPDTGPPIVWELQIGATYASPAIADGRLVLFHRLANNEIIECRDATTGKLHWQHKYPSKYTDRYGFNNGPRCSPVISDDNRVVTYGVEGELCCFDLATGKLNWQRNLKTDYNVKDQYFGIGATPLILDNKIIINVGAPNGPCVAALDLQTGKTIWQAGKDWGPSYACPIPLNINNKQHVAVFAGGDDRPPTGGLLVLDVADGTIRCRYPFRSKKYESVNAASPAINDDNSIFISTSYNTGGVLVQLDDEGNCEKKWTTDKLGLHFMTPIFHDGYLYGCDGMSKSDSAIVCLDAATGKQKWREAPEWTETVTLRDTERELTMSTMRCQLLALPDGFLCFTEMGHLLSLDLSPTGLKVRDRARLFFADESFAMPVLSHGLLYVSQFRKDALDDTPPRLICYDVRGS